jgi:23S rRNA (uracil1939-C5)-methyltransferase
MTKNSFELQLTTITHGGAALGRHEGRAIFVPYALPGETARVEIVEDKGRYAFARLVEVLAPSPERVASPCPYFGLAAGGGACGGCQWQHAEYQAQLPIPSCTLPSPTLKAGPIATTPSSALP